MVVNDMKYILTFLILLGSVFGLKGEPANNYKYSAYSGRHFYISFMQNEIALSWQNDKVLLRVFITAVIPTKYEIKIPGFETVTGELQANDVHEIEIPYQMEMIESEVPRARAIEISSDLPVSAYCFSSKITTSESYSAIPISRWGTEYVVMSYPNDQYDDPERWNLDSLERFVPRSSEFLVMAAYDSTVVTMTPRAVTKGGKQVGQTYNVLLQKGEVYLVQSFADARGRADLTGTIVRGNKPFGLLSGHVRTAVPQTNKYPFDSKDHLIEMLPPTSTWGKYFCTIPFGVNFKGDLFRLASIHPNTVVTLQRQDGIEEELYLSNPGDWVEVTDINTPAVWRGNKPFQLVQYMRHTGEYGDSKEYDPSIVVIPPVEQYVQDIVFLTPRNFQVQDQYREHRVSLIADAPALADLSLDGDKVQDLTNFYSQQITGTSLYWGSLGLSEGRHQLKSSKGRFSGVLYAYGFHDSYAMALGNSLSNPFREDSVPPTIVVNEKCGFINGFVHDVHDTNSSGIDFGWAVKYQNNNYQWDIPLISDTATVVRFSASPIDINQNGNFNIEFYDKNSNLTKYSFQYQGIKINAPKEMLYPNLSWEKEECKQFKVFNFGTRNMTLDSITIANEPRLNYTTSLSLPALMKPGDTLYITLCFNPTGDSATLFTDLTLHFDCDYNTKIQVKGNVKAPQIAIGGHDFGEVTVGETRCDTVTIENLGNTDLFIDSLILSQILPEFTFNISGILPIKLASGGKLRIPVCFTPFDTLNYEIKVSAKNNFDLLNEGIVMGRGIAPNINSIRLDWGNRRVGTLNDSLMSFINSGSKKGTLIFDKLITGDPGDDNALLLKSISTVLDKGEKLPLLFVYNPIAPVPYELIAEFTTDWLLHKPITVYITGNGTLPTIETNDFRFDTTRIFSSVDSSMLAITAGGNERLSIDKMQTIGGDLSSFVIDLATYDNMKLNIGEELVIPVTFAPNRVGEHILLIEVISDALPNYERKRDTIIVSGYALPADTIDYSFELKLPSLFACVAEQGYLELSNLGNININLQEMIATKTPDNFTANFKDIINLPMLLKPGETVRFDMDFYAERGQGGKLGFALLINDSIRKNIEFDIMPIVATIEVNGPDLMTLTAGDTISLTLRGNFPHAVDPLVEGKFELGLDKYFLDLLNKNGTLLIRNSNEEYNVPINFVQNRWTIVFNMPKDLYEINENTEWETTLRFLALLYEKDTANLDFGLFSDRCFNPAKLKIPIKLLHVCNFPLRPIKIIANLPFVDIAPNPISTKIGVEIFLTEDDEVSLSVVDAMGRQTELEQNKTLTRGRHLLEYSSDRFASGIYNLIMHSKQLKKNKIFIITK